MIGLLQSGTGSGTRLRIRPGNFDSRCPSGPMIRGERGEAPAPGGRGAGGRGAGGRGADGGDSAAPNGDAPAGALPSGVAVAPGLIDPELRRLRRPSGAQWRATLVEYPACGRPGGRGARGRLGRGRNAGRWARRRRADGDDRGGGDVPAGLEGVETGVAGGTLGLPEFELGTPLALVAVRRGTADGRAGAGAGNIACRDLLALLGAVWLRLSAVALLGRSNCGCRPAGLAGNRLTDRLGARTDPGWRPGGLAGSRLKNRLGALTGCPLLTAGPRPAALAPAPGWDLAGSRPTRRPGVRTDPGWRPADLAGSRLTPRLGVPTNPNWNPRMGCRAGRRPGRRRPARGS